MMRNGRELKVSKIKFAVLTLMCFGMTGPPVFAEGCSMATLAQIQGKSFVFQKLQLEVATLMQGQSEAIIEVQTGVTLSSADDGGFFGPTGFLRKRMDKGQSSINSLLISARRMKLEEEASRRLGEIKENAEKIVATGLEMAPLLEAGEIEKATRLYADISLPAQVEALGAAYTMASEYERSGKLMALKCK